MRDRSIKLCFAVCTHNRVASLRALLPVMRRQACQLPFEVLVVDSSSSDSTRHAVRSEMLRPKGVSIRYVFESQLGIIAARNRAIQEAQGCDYLMFIDDDEVPADGLLEAAIKAIQDKDADCVGGRIQLVFPGGMMPAWFTADQAHHLGGLDHGEQSFRLEDESKPVWTGNVIYNMRLFEGSDPVCFDVRYDRIGHTPYPGGSGEMLRLLLDRSKRVFYDPAMSVYHLVPKAHLSRRYLMSKDYRGGFRYGLYRSSDLDRSIGGVPLFMFKQATNLCARAAMSYVARKKRSTAELVKAANYIGDMAGRFHKHKMASSLPK